MNGDIRADQPILFRGIPARSFGPALLVGGDALKCVWVFIAAPLVGGVLAALAYQFLDGKKSE